MDSSRPSRKDRTHDRILDAAARALRRNGLDGVGVAEVMKDAGLTHGGFYAHFASRDAMLAAALERAGRNSAVAINRAVATRRTHGVSVFRAFVDSYLADAHLASTEAGCPVAALASDLARCVQGDAASAADVRRAARQRVARLVTGVHNTLPAGTPPDAAGVVAGALVGTLQLARALGDNAEGRALLAAGRRALLAQYDVAQYDVAQYEVAQYDVAEGTLRGTDAGSAAPATAAGTEADADEH